MPTTAQHHSSSLDRPQVLLAEDDPDYRELIADALALDGYDVIAVQNGIEAMNYLDIAVTDPLTSGFPSVVVTDINMPGIDGLELLSHTSHIPTVVVTAFGSDEVHDEARRRGAHRVFDKPFELSELRAVVRGLAAGRVTEVPNPRLLIADDDRDFVAYLSDLVVTRNAGTVVTAHNGVDALEALAERGPFDLVCTDHRMPGPNGAQLVTMIRYAGYQGPILIVTAFPGNDLQRVLENHERVSLVPKSATPEQIVSAAARLIDESRSRSVH